MILNISTTPELINHRKREEAIDPDFDLCCLVADLLVLIVFLAEPIALNPQMSA